MGRSIPPIPRPTRNIPKVLVDILTPMREALQIRFINGDNDTAITRQDLIDLGLVTQEQINQLDE